MPLGLFVDESLGLPEVRLTEGVQHIGSLLARQGQGLLKGIDGFPVKQVAEIRLPQGRCALERRLRGVCRLEQWQGIVGLLDVQVADS